jgi:hypothetical protein
MALLPLDDAVARFSSNEDKINTFVHGNATASYNTSEGESVPSISKIVATLSANRFPDGSLAAPSIGFANDPDLGFRRSSLDEISLVTAGQDRLLVSAPRMQLNSELMQINGPATGSSIIGSRNGSNAWFLGDQASAVGTGAGLTAWVYGADPFRVYTNGVLRIKSDNVGTSIYTRVGINTSSPQTDLHVVGDSIVTGSLTTGNSIGLGGTPSTWPLPALELFNGAVSSLGGPFGQINISSNATASGSADIGSTVWQYKRGIAGDLGNAGLYSISGGGHLWYSSTSAGLAGAAIPFKNVMALDTDTLAVYGHKINLSSTNLPWNANFKSVNLGTYTSLWDFNGGYGGIATNAYYDNNSGTWKRKTYNPALLSEHDISLRRFVWSFGSGDLAGTDITFQESMVLEKDKLRILPELDIGSSSNTLPWSVSNGLSITKNNADAAITNYYDNTTISIAAGVSQKTGITISGQTSGFGNEISMRVGNNKKVRITTGMQVGDSLDTFNMPDGGANITVTSRGQDAANVPYFVTNHRALIGSSDTKYQAGGILFAGYRDIEQTSYLGGMTLEARNAANVTSVPTKISFRIGGADTGNGGRSFNSIGEAALPTEKMSLLDDGWLHVTGGVVAQSRIIASGNGNDYNAAAFEVKGGGTNSPGILPTIGFHNPNDFAGSLRQNNADTFGFYEQGGVATAALEISALYANDAAYAREGFITTEYKLNQRNPIWRFGNSQEYGLSYFQGTSGYNGIDSIGIHFSNQNGNSATGPGSHIIFTPDSRVIARQFQGLADRSQQIIVTDGEGLGIGRNLTNSKPNSVLRSITADFANAAVTGTGGNYAGVMTITPYDGTTASTGGPSYQLAFGSSLGNGGTPQLRLRNGIDTTWNAWTDVITAANINQFSGSNSFRNRLTNGNFAINQRVVGGSLTTGTVVLGADQHGHDYWKAGASGCNYTFSTSQNITTINITSGTLYQVINGKDLFSGTHVLSWTGTAQARINGDTYSGSGKTFVVTGGNTVTVEFSTGTVSLAQFEMGTLPTSFEHRLNELQLCQRRYFKTYNQAAAPGTNNVGGSIHTVQTGSSTYLMLSAYFPVTMEAVPAVTIYHPTTGATGQFAADSGTVSAVVHEIGEKSLTARVNNVPVSTNVFVSAHFVAVAGL